MHNCNNYFLSKYKLASELRQKMAHKLVHIYSIVELEINWHFPLTEHEKKENANMITTSSLIQHIPSLQQNKAIVPFHVGYC